MIGKGVRFNAEKKKVGNYYSTALYSFSMKCPTCAGIMVIETDPKNCDYKLVSGGYCAHWHCSVDDDEMLSRGATQGGEVGAGGGGRHTTTAVRGLQEAGCGCYVQVR